MQRLAAAHGVSDTRVAQFAAVPSQNHTAAELEMTSSERLLCEARKNLPITAAGQCVEDISVGIALAIVSSFLRGTAAPPCVCKVCSHACRHGNAMKPRMRTTSNMQDCNHDGMGNV